MLPENFNPPEVTRRTFLSSSTKLAVGTALLGTALNSRTGYAKQPAATEARKTKGSPYPICVFVKYLQTLSFDELADTIAAMEVSGIEATVRTAGQILPEHVEEKLPQLVEALRKRNLEVTIMTSNVNRADDPLTEKVLRTAAGLGIKRYRMNYYKYDLKKPVIAQLNELKPVVKDLAALNRELGIQGVYQNHAGPTYVGAAIWDMQQILEGIPKEEIALAYDIRHAAVEGGTSWRTTWNIAQPHLGSVFIKNTRWKNAKLNDGPLGMEDSVVTPEFFRMLEQSDFKGPLSLHVEYLPKEPPQVQIQEIQKNLATLRELLAKSK